MTNVIRLFSEQARLMGLSFSDKPLPTAAPSRNNARFAEALRESLCTLGSAAFDFSEARQEGNDWDIEAWCGEHRFLIEISFLQAEWKQAAEWVVTIVPESDFRLSQPKTVNATALRTLNQVVRSALAHRRDVTILTPTEPPAFAAPGTGSVYTVEQSPPTSKD